MLDDDDEPALRIAPDSDPTPTSPRPAPIPLTTVRFLGLPITIEVTTYHPGPVPPVRVRDDLWLSLRG